MEMEMEKKKSEGAVKNTAIKFFIDQTVGATVNTLLFIVGMGALKGFSGEEIVGAVKEVST